MNKMISEVADSYKKSGHSERWQIRSIKKLPHIKVYEAAIY